MIQSLREDVVGGMEVTCLVQDVVDCSSADHSAASLSVLAIQLSAGLAGPRSVLGQVVGSPCTADRAPSHTVLPLQS